MSIKKELRDKYKIKRNTLLNKEQLSNKIASLFLSSIIYKNSKTVLCYCAIGSEVNCNKIILTALEDGKKVAVPKCMDNCGNMKFYYIKSVAELSKGMFAIPEPDSVSEFDHLEGDTVCVVPGICFDKSGHRIGYGKGYYDRFLSLNKNIVSVGVCFEECLTENISAEEKDEKIQFLITEKRIYKFDF